VHRKYSPVYIQQDAALHSLLYLETALHVSGVTFTHQIPDAVDTVVCAPGINTRNM
jgi:hypothetical protein